MYPCTAGMIWLMSPMSVEPMRCARTRLVHGAAGGGQVLPEDIGDGRVRHHVRVAARLGPLQPGASAERASLGRMAYHLDEFALVGAVASADAEARRRSGRDDIHGLAAIGDDAVDAGVRRACAGGGR